jgi:uncharacterized surface protein with fasciclin (FAS1) repeats
MPVNSNPPLGKRLMALLSLASLGALVGFPVTAEVESRRNAQTATPGLNLLAQAGLRTIADEIDIQEDGFSTLNAAISAAGLTDNLARGGPFTVFAPTNQAFEELPDGTVQNLLQPRNRSRLTRILTYHVVPGDITTFDLTPGQTLRLRTLAGETLRIRVTSANDIFVNDSKVVMADIPATNGTIHGINDILMP